MIIETGTVHLEGKSIIEAIKMEDPNNPGHSYFEREESKRLTMLFWKSRDTEVQLRDMGFFR